MRTRFWGGGRSEDLLIESVARTVGQFHGIGRVVISVEGDVWQTLAGHIDISEPFEVIGPARVH